MIKRHTDFQDMMNVSIETEDKWLNRKLNSHICYGKGGGGGGGNQQQDVPPTLRPYVTDVLNRAKALYGAETQYIPYQGERVVPFTSEELAAQEGITGMVGRGISQDPFLSSAGAYYAPAYGLLGEAGALQAGAAREITADEIMGRMSPYQQAVTDITKREAMKEAQLYGQKLKGQAATTGGFGGSRQAILEAQAAADLGGRLTDIQAKGQQEAYMNALAMAEQQRAREMGAGQALSGLSGMYGNLGQQALGQAYRELGYLSGVGEAQRGMGQQRADIAYQDFIAQRDFPDTQLQKYSSLIQGFPFQFNMPGAQPSQFQQTVGAATALGGLGRGLGFFTQGGQVEAGGKKYPNTGLAALAQERPDVVKKMGYKDGGTVYRQEAGQIGRPNISGLSAFLAPFAGERTNPFKDMSDDEVAQIARFGDNPMKQDAAERELAERMSKVPTGKSPVKQQTSQTPDSAPTSNNTPSSTVEKVENKQAAEVQKSIDNVGELADVYQKYRGTGTAPTEDILKNLGLDSKTKEILDKAFDFDREAKEKAIKAQQGFDVAALGLELMSTPLSKIDKRMISQLGVSQKELAGLGEEEAKSMLQKALTEQALKKGEADIFKTLREAQAEGQGTYGVMTPSDFDNVLISLSQTSDADFALSEYSKQGIPVQELMLEAQERARLEAPTSKENQSKRQVVIFKELLEEYGAGPIANMGSPGNIVSGQKAFDVAQQNLYNNKNTGI